MSTRVTSLYPEQFTEEQRHDAQACQDFIERRSLQNIEQMTAWSIPELVPSIFQELEKFSRSIGTSRPEQYGGMAWASNTSIVDRWYYWSMQVSFSTTYWCPYGIRFYVPIVHCSYVEYFTVSNAYVWKVCVWRDQARCLHDHYVIAHSEPVAYARILMRNSGKTKATLSADGKTYIAQWSRRCDPTLRVLQIYSSFSLKIWKTDRFDRIYRGENLRWTLRWMRKKKRWG